MRRPNGHVTTRLEACPSCGQLRTAPPPSPLAPPPPPPVTSYAAPYPAPSTPLPAPPAPPGGLSAASVPKILLGLGATCLLVAAVIFLAVAWSWLGIGGRTAVLVGLTVGAALAGQWLARRDLGVGAEALTTVALGLVVLDLFGARNAHWIDVAADESFLALLGGALLTVSLVLCAPATRLLAPQVAAPLGLGLAVIGIGADTGHGQVVATVAVLAFTALAVGGRALGTVVLPWTSAAGAGLAFTALVGSAMNEASEYPSVRGLWVEGHGIGMLAVAALVLLPWAIVRNHDDLRQLVCACAVSVLTVAAAVPVLDGGLTGITVTAAATTLVWTVVAAAVPPRWYAVPRVPLVGSLLALAPVPVVLSAQALASLLSVGEPFSTDASVRLHPETPIASPLLLPLGVAVVLVAAVLTVPRSGWFRWPVGAAAALTAFLTAFLTAALFPLPLWLFVAALGPLGVAVALPSAVLTLLALAEIVLVAAWLLVRRVAAVEPMAGTVLPLAAAAFLWTGGHVFEVSFEVRSLVTLATLALLAIAVPRIELEVCAAFAVALSSVAAVAAATDPSVSAAIQLTLAGAAVTTTALVHRDHRELAWLGGLLLAAADTQGKPSIG
ncbi:MAG: hypothetical protein QOD98_3649, partial [Nocardioidaceae bacterium]|nr:hypothetical protein [Nocardioidaceae bacterium]